MKKRKKKSWRKKLIALGIVIAVIGIPTAIVAWYKFFRVVPQPEWITSDPEMRFKYGSFGGEAEVGLPYWIWLVLPRVFPDLMPGPGGYASFGFVWEEGREVPIGFAKKTVGFPRITNNCAICHTTQYRLVKDQTPVIETASPGQPINIQAYIRFLSKAAGDPRWTADILLAEIEQAYELSFLDRQIYQYLLIPLTRKALVEQNEAFAWMNRPDWPDWGPGRTDPMNLTKYFLAKVPLDNTVGMADSPSLWNLKIRDGEGMALQWDGSTPSARSVVIDSALGLGADPAPPFVELADQLHAWLSTRKAPAWPAAAPKIEVAKADRGQQIYSRRCASCHDVGSARMGKVMPIAEIKTDPNRLDSWTQEAANQANDAVEELGIKRVHMIKTQGYVSPPLDGIWLRAPYLHNGSVPTLRDLLRPANQRTPVFYRGYDLYDPVDVGFVHAGLEAERVGYRFDTSVRGNGNMGHEYGADLSEAEKSDLIEYLKRL